jgi:hypothetical protein
MKLYRINKKESNSFRYFIFLKKENYTLVNSIKNRIGVESFIKDFSEFFNQLNFLFLKTNYKLLESLDTNSNKLIVKWNTLKYENYFKTKNILLILKQQRFMKIFKNHVSKNYGMFSYNNVLKKGSKKIIHLMFGRFKSKHFNFKENRFFFFLSEIFLKIQNIFKYKNSNTHNF